MGNFMRKKSASSYQDLISLDQKYLSFLKMTVLPNPLINIVMEFMMETKITIVITKNVSHKYSIECAINAIYDERYYDVTANGNFLIPITLSWYDSQIVIIDDCIIMRYAERPRRSIILKINVDSRGIIVTEDEKFETQIYNNYSDMCSYAGSVYFLGGDQAYCVPCKKVFKMINNKLQRIEDMHYPRRLVCLIEYERKFFVIGSSVNQTVGRTMEFYDGIKWTLCDAKMNYPRAWSSAVVLSNNYLYVIGGSGYYYNHGNGNPCHTPTVEMYDFEKQIWKFVASLKNAREKPVNAFVKNEHILCCCE